jgi:hypothetical protein
LREFFVYFGHKSVLQRDVMPFLSNTLPSLSAFYYCNTIDYRAKKVGFTTCVIIALVNDNDTGTEPNENRKH